MSGFRASERRALRAVCETLAPRLEEDGEIRPLDHVASHDLQLGDRVEEALYEIARPEQLRQLRVFLRSLEVPLTNGLLSGHWVKFSEAPLATRTEILRSWSESRLALRRQAFQGLKRLALFLFYTLEPGNGPNPTWEAIGYEPAPAPDPDSTKHLHPLDLDGPTELRADVVVVGSGAGGGVIAAELAAAGKDVLIVEKGGYHDVPDFHGRELQANRELFERQGGLTTGDASMVVLAGSTLGGGTVVNWSTSLPTPERVREEWSSGYGFDGVEGSDYDRSLRVVRDRLHVDRDESEANPQNSLLAEGGEQLGIPVETIPRNVDGCVDCTYCGFGCRYRAKQSTLETYLRDAAAAGARILVNTHVDRVEHTNGRATGVSATVTSNGRGYELRIRAGAVVLAAGALHTPAILLRSGVRNPNLGRHLRLHPVTAPIGVYDDPVRSWEGPPQTRLIQAFKDVSGDGYGFRLEVAPAHPGLWASALPWTSGRGHKRLMAQLDHLGNIISIVRDRGSGRVELDGEGQPQLQYDLDPYDAENLMQGTLQALRLHRAAGARLMLSPHSQPLIFQRGDNGFQDYLDSVVEKGVRPNGFGLFSAHQMGSCRISGDRGRGVVRPDGRSWDLEGLYVADASVFPTACGVNPMIPIMATSHFLAQRIKASI
ncbi:MAG: FAD-dependent oxidoreductase [Anaerolineales bacterium]|nr:FAD-dependent oxidoreductase [Anaerolineales bacterium]